MNGCIHLVRNQRVEERDSCDGVAGVWSSPLRLSEIEIMRPPVLQCAHFTHPSLPLRLAETSMGYCIRLLLILGCPVQLTYNLVCVCFPIPL